MSAKKKLFKENVVPITIPSTMITKQVIYYSANDRSMFGLGDTTPSSQNKNDNGPEIDEDGEKVETWRDFCDATSIHGLRYIGGNYPPPLGYRIIWATVWVCMFCLCIWLCTNSILTYTAWDVNTATTFQVVDHIDYPAITFCNENPFKRSMIGGSMEFMRVMATLSTWNASEIDDLTLENNETCYYDGPLSDYAKALKVEGDAYFLKRGLVQGLRQAAFDSQAGAAKCWWNSTEIDCPSVLINEAIDHEVCFTFNLGEDIVRAINENGTVQPFYGYGLDVKNYSQHRLINAGPHNGFRILLNVNQSEYCGAGRKWSGAGFKAIVHDPGVKPWFVLEPTLSFSPGFDTNVVLKPTVFNRRTSNLGRCSDFVFLHLNPEATKYFKSACYQQCFTEYVWKKCKCFPTTAYRNQKDVYINKEKVNITKFCWGESMTCLIYAEEHFLQNNPDAACPICEEPCIDTKYEFEVSSFLFPSDHLAEMYAEELHTKVELLEDNFVVVNFHYESMNMRVIDETQAFTLLDLFTYFGGIIGLFLGMSIMSLAEVLHQIRITAKKKMREKRMREQLSTNVVSILSKQRLVDAKSLSSEKKLVFCSIHFQMCLRM